MSHRLKLVRVWLLAWMLGLGGEALRACGPYLPSSVITTDEAVLSAPQASFRDELLRMLPVAAPEFCAIKPVDGDPKRQTAEVEAAELREALGAGDASTEEQRRIMAEHSSLRGGSSVAEARIPGLPAEFADYQRGRLAYHQGRFTDAIGAWEALLGRPVDERRYRSTWAAFMIGRTWLESDPDKAVPWFEKVRQLAREGYRDGLGLAVASLGWQGRAELLQGHHAAAMELYLQQLEAGDETAVRSLGDTVESLLWAGAEALKEVAGNGRVRHVVTAYIIARGGPYHDVPSEQAVIQWLKATESAGVGVVEGADRLAWAAYHAGKMDLARRWVDRAPEDSMYTHWIRGKLHLRGGRLEEAAAALAAALKRSAAAPTRWLPNIHYYHDDDDDVLAPAERLARDLGTVQLSRGRFVEALDLLMRGRDWLDAAYVAERVLTIDELARYVDVRDPEPPGDGPAGSDDSGRTLRYLLARRLGRAGQWERARTYFPPKMAGLWDQYVSALRAGRDPQGGAAERAESLWAAAQLARRHGMELLGTELEPDWGVFGGSYERESIVRARSEGRWLAAIPAGFHELSRVARPELAFSQRFHYRYIAAEHAWEAAGLLPDETEQKARILWTAGGWLKDRDPQGADRFYRALARRCGTTPLGSAARHLRWFPDSQAQAARIHAVYPHIGWKARLAGLPGSCGVLLAAGVMMVLLLRRRRRAGRLGNAPILAHLM